MTTILVGNTGGTMEITYKREISHCSTNPHVREATIAEVRPAQNSDFLDCITFNEIGWNVISQRGLHKPGESVIFIPPESVLPTELSDALGVTAHLSSGRVRVIGLRGNRSEGLIASREIAEPYLPYIMKWEDLPAANMRGNALGMKGVSPYFDKFYDMPNLLNAPDKFTPGESISYSEKIHGTNARCGILPHPETSEDTLYVGSHNCVFQEDKDNLYWQVMRKRVADRLPKGYTFYGEIFGGRIQKGMSYDRSEHDILFFAATSNGEYLLPADFKNLCDLNDLPRVNLHGTIYVCTERIRELAELPSEFSKSHMREGVVVVSSERPGIMAKCIGFSYLAKKNRTERH